MASLDFIGNDPAVSAYDRGTDFENQQYDVRSRRNVDAAIRGGVSDMLSAQQQPALALPPQPATAPAPAVQAPEPAPAAAPSGTGSGLAAVGFGPAPPPVANRAPPGVPPSRPVSTTPTGGVMDSGALQDDGGLRNAVAKVEAGNHVINAGGYAGKYQFGTAALAAAGVYQPAAGENLKSNSWSGTINLPGRGPMTVQQFINDDGAQDQAWGMHTNNLDREIANRGLDRFIGQTVKGVPITRSSLIMLMQQAGPTGTQKYLESGGAYDPTDGNLHASEYATRVAGNMGAPTGAPGQPQPTAATPSTSALGLGGAPVVQSSYAARYDPLLERLAATPGGGTAALQIMQQQRQVGQQDLNRQTAYQRLAMQALGRGDQGVFNYYAQLGGINLPQSLVQDAGMSKRLATISLVAERFYKNDPAAAQKLTQTYLQTGNMDQAFSVAGTPKDNPRLQIQWLKRGEQEVATSFNPQSGQMAPINGPDGQPMTRDARPTAGAGAKVQWVTQDDGSSLAYQPHPDGTMSPVSGPDGQQMRQAPRQASSAKVADRTVRYNMLVKAGVPDKDANMIAAGGTVSPNTIANTYSRVLGSYTKSALTDEDTKAIPARVADVMGTMFGPNWQSIMHGQTAPAGPDAPAGPLPPAPTDTPPPPAAAPSAPFSAPGDPYNGIPAPAAAPAPTAPAAPGLQRRPANLPAGTVWSQSRRQYRDPAGRLYDEQGNPVQGQ